MLTNAYQRVRRWPTRVEFCSLTGQAGVKISELDKVIVPVHLGVHWTLAVVNLKKKRIEFYDSLGGFAADVIETLQDWVVKEFKDKTGEDIDMSTWSVFNPNEIPSQANGYDCGVFLCQYADCCAAGIDFDFTQKNIPIARKRMQLWLLNKRLDDA